MDEPAPASPRLRTGQLGVAAWLLFGWATQPFYTVLMTFIYAPYFATGIAADPAEGQALWGLATSVAGLVVAVLAPLLGAIADASGRRKPWMAGFGAMLAVGSFALWIGRPHDPTIIMPVLVAYALGAIGVQCALVFANAMMPALVPPERLGRLSGTGWAIGYIGGLVSLIVTLGWLATNPQTGMTMLGLLPILDHQPGLHQGERATGPLTAIWFVVFALPLFLFTPDEPARLPVRDAVRQGLSTLGETLRRLQQHRDLGLFLLANMIYADGLVALFAFGGIYGAGTFGWSAIDTGTFGTLLTITGTFGAIVGGRLDDRFGSKSVIIGSLIILILAATAILSIEPDRIAFFIPVAPSAPGRGLYSSTAERTYVGVGLIIGAVAGPAQAASRSLLARLAPADRLTQFFGLLALSGTVTSFAGPFLVGTVTAATMSQKAGMAVLVAFFLVGALLVSHVRVAPSPRPNRSPYGNSWKRFAEENDAKAD